ncbi:MAG: hypothetical protein IT538_00120 [Variibacter sp.]|nr:hypothetical protein [Variibacter sp.]
MRKFSVVVIALAAAGVSAGASAQNMDLSVLQKDPGMARSFAPQTPMQLGGGSGQAFAASPAAATAAPSQLTELSSVPASAMTAPTAPGSGFSIAFGSTPDIAQGMSAGAFSKDEPQPGTFSTASAERSEVGASGVPPMLGVDLSTDTTRSFGTSGQVGSGIRLGQ